MPYTIARPRADIKIHGHENDYTGGKLDFGKTVITDSVGSLLGDYLYLPGRTTVQTLYQLNELAPAMAVRAHGPIDAISPVDATKVLMGWYQNTSNPNPSSYIRNDGSWNIGWGSYGTSNYIMTVGGRVRIAENAGFINIIPSSANVSIQTNAQCVFSTGISASYLLSPIPGTAISSISQTVSTGVTVNIAEWKTQAGGVVLASLTKDFYFKARQFLIAGTTSGVISHAAPAVVTDYTLTWPAATANGVLVNTGGVLSFAASAPPGAHTHDWADITGEPTTLAGYGITGTLAEFNAALTGADFATGGGTATGTNTGDQTITLTGHVTGSGTGSFATVLGSFTSAQLLAALSDETGTGANAFATSPTLVTPLLGTPTSGVLTNCTGLPETALVDGTLLARVAANEVITGTWRFNAPIGFAMASPASPVDFGTFGDSYSGQTILLRHNANSRIGLGVDNVGGTYGVKIFAPSDASHILDLGTMSAADGTTFTPLVTLLTGGNLGIGAATTNPLEKLAIGYGSNTTVAIGTATNNKLFLGTYQDGAALSINRNPATGVFSNAALYHVEVVTNSLLGYIAFATPAAVNTEAAQRRVIGLQKTLTDNTTADLLACTIANGTCIAGSGEYCVEVRTATDFQLEIGSFQFHASKAGAAAISNLVTFMSGTQQLLTAVGSTLNVSFTITGSGNSATLKVNANSSLTPTFLKLTYELRNLTQQAVTYL